MQLSLAMICLSAKPTHRYQPACPGFGLDPLTFLFKLKQYMVWFGYRLANSRLDQIAAHLNAEVAVLLARLLHQLLPCPYRRGILQLIFYSSVPSETCDNNNNSDHF